MAIRWYQHKTQGGNFIISLKNKLPIIARVATSQQANIKGFNLSELDSAKAISLKDESIN
jgi:hypothetical protein